MGRRQKTAAQRAKKKQKDEERRQRKAEQVAERVAERPKRSRRPVLLPLAFIGIAGASVGYFLTQGKPGENAPIYDLAPVPVVDEAPADTGFVPNVIDPSAPLEQRTIEAIENYLGHELNEYSDYRFFEGSRTIQVFLPDVHKDEYQEEQIRQLRKLREDFESAGISISGLGLEGFLLGMITDATISDYRSVVEADERMALRMVREFEEAYYPVHEEMHRLIRERRADDDFISRFEMLGMTYEALMQAYVHLARAATREEFQISAGAPGGDYLSAFGGDVPVFGMESPEGLEYTHNLSDYYWVIQAVELARYSTTIVRDWAARYPDIAESFVPFLHYLGRIVDMAEEANTVLKERLPDEVFEPGFDLERQIQHNIDRVRTRDWVSSVPYELGGVVLMVGGKGHVPAFRSIAAEQEQSYIVLPELD